MAEVRVGFIGCGGNARRHMRDLLKMVRVTYPDAVKSLELSLAANKSLETGAPVDLPI